MRRDVCVCELYVQFTRAYIPSIQVCICELYVQYMYMHHFSTIYWASVNVYTFSALSQGGAERSSLLYLYVQQVSRKFQDMKLSTLQVPGQSLVQWATPCSVKSYYITTTCYHLFTGFGTTWSSPGQSHWWSGVRLDGAKDITDAVGGPELCRVGSDCTLPIHWESSRFQGIYFCWTFFVRSCYWMDDITNNSEKSSCMTMHFN